MKCTKEVKHENVRANDQLAREAVLVVTVIASIAIPLGQRFAIREGGKTVGAGKVLSINH